VSCSNHLILIKRENKASDGTVIPKKHCAEEALVLNVEKYSHFWGISVTCLSFGTPDPSSQQRPTLPSLLLARNRFVLAHQQERTPTLAQEH
jgi:hypothetical protein